MARPPSSTFRILHISDLHRDPQSIFSPRDLVESLLTDVREVFRDAPFVDAIVFSGDAVDRGDSTEEYKQADEFLHTLCSGLFPELDAEQNRSRLVLIPGNHDIDWSVCREAIKAAPHKPEHETEEHYWKTERGGKGYFERSLYRNKLQHFAELLFSSTGNKWPTDFAQQVLDYVLLEPKNDAIEMGLVAIGVNTAYLVHHERNDAGLSTDAVGHAKKLLREKYPADRWIRILIQHHPSRPYRDGVNDQISYDKESEFLREFSLVLHGHVHEHFPQSQMQLGGGKLPIVGAGTLFAAGKERPEAIGLEYNLVVLDLKGALLQVFPRQRDNANSPWRTDNRYVEDGSRSYELTLRVPAKATRSSSPKQRDLGSTELDFIEASVERTELFAPFFKYARERDVVFALGGVGGGLDTFFDQFQGDLEKHGSPSFAAIDFDYEDFKKIRDARSAMTQALEPFTSLSRDLLDLKCLFAALAFEVCHTLCAKYPDGVYRVIGKNSVVDPVRFLEYYFAHSDAMDKGEAEPIVKYFFDTLQKVAEATGEDVIVLMPWKRLASCFKSGVKNQGGVARWELAFQFWTALGSFIGPSEKYGKVCLVVGASEFPYGHRVFKTALVARSLWPLPPLDIHETHQLLNLKCPTLSGVDVAKLVEATGGSPWITRLVLSFLQPLAEAESSVVDHDKAQMLVNKGIDLAKEAIITGGDSVRGGLKAVIVRYLKSIKETLGDGAATDSGIEAAWAGNANERRRGYNIESPRVEAFVASGLVWLDGDPWDSNSKNGVFKHYPHLHFRPPSDIAIAAYEHLTGRKISP